MGETKNPLDLLDQTILKRKGLKAAINHYDDTHVTPFKVVTKLYKANEYEWVSDSTLTQNNIQVDIRIPEKKKSMKELLNKAVEVNKEAAIDTAYLALGKAAVELGASRLPKEVGMLGPLVVAEALAAIPSDNPKVNRAQVAALTYAMYVTYGSTAVAAMLEDLTKVAEEVVGEAD